MQISDEAKELFADILISFQRGEIDLADALIQVRSLEVPDEEGEDGDEGEGEGEGESGEGDAEGDAEDNDDGETEGEPTDEELQADAAEVNDALALIADL